MVRFSKVLIVAMIITSGSYGAVSEEAKTFEPNDFLGAWYGETQGERSITRWVIQREIEGKYEILFVVCEDGATTWIQKEYGDWDYRNGIYRTITRTIEDIDGRRKPDTPEKTYVETYRVITLNADIFAYVHIKKDKRYTARKVGDSYEINCD